MTEGAEGAEGGVCELDDVAMLRANPWAVGGFAAPSIACVSFMVIAPPIWGLHGKDGASCLRVMFYGAFVGMGGAVHFSRGGRKPAPERHRLKASRAGVALDGTMIVARDEIASGVVLPNSRHGTIVRLERKGLF